LRVPESRKAQADLAKQYGIEAFCYYHYWFGGRRILEKTFDAVLASGEPDFPFCLCWANQSWTGIWHNAPGRTLIEQTYPGDDDHRQHFDWLLGAFHDRRYLKIAGRPVFLVFDPLALPDAPRVCDPRPSLGYESGQLKLAGKPPQFGIDRLDGLDMSLGPSPVLRVRCYAGSAFLGSWPGALAAMQLASGSTSNGGVLTHPAGPGLCTAPAPRPIGTKTGCMASFNESYVVNFFH
jgi:hypothetical protein